MPFQEPNPLDLINKGLPPTYTPTPSGNPLDDLNRGVVKPSSGNPLDDLNRQETPFLERVGNQIGSAIGSIPGVQPVISTLSPVLEFLGRPAHASAKFADSLADSSKSVLDAIADSFGELTADTFLNPNQKQ